MPTKKPWTSTAFGTDSPKAWKQAHSTAMFAAQNPTAPTIASRPLAGCRRIESASRVPLAIVAGMLATRRARPTRRCPRAQRATSRSKSPRDQRHQEER